MILNRLCYASGNSEWGMANPTKTTAIKRVDNYGAGFLRAGAKAVFAHAIESARYTIVRAVHGRSGRWTRSSWPTRRRAGPATSTSTRPGPPAMKAHMDPPRSGKYWRSVIGDLSMKASEWRAGAELSAA